MTERFALQFSIAGLLVCAGILLYMQLTRSSAVTGLIASMAFGATALATLTSLGGSSPLIFVFFVLLLLLSVLTRGNPITNVGYVFSASKTAWIVAVLLIYAVVGSLLFPRLFAGKASVFVSSRETGHVYETVLAPTSGNITQTGYLVLGGLCFFAVLILMTRYRSIEDIKRGFFLMCGLHATMGMIDLIAKYAGAGDVLGFIRSANYALLTEASEAGLPRVVGAFPEASSFGAASLACLAFTYTYWREAGSRAAFWLSAVLFILVLFSTSSAAYVSLAVLSLPVAAGMLRSLGSKQLHRNELLMIGAVLFGFTAAVGLGVVKPPVVDSVTGLVDRAIIHKASSASGQERSYWNEKSLEAVAETSALGVGLGSSRASSWPVAVLSQLGLIGALLFSALLYVLVFGVRHLRSGLDPDYRTVVLSVRASALAGLVTLSLTGGSADPGIFLFVAVAVVTAARLRAERSGNAAAAATYRPGTALRQEPLEA